MKLSKRINIVVLIVILIYLLLTVICLNHGYFWDNIQQISKEAHWFYQTDFSRLLMPAQNSGSEIVATGYHPPLMGIMTALLWKVFGYKLWVSHIFISVWFGILIFNLWKLINRFFDSKYASWILLIVLLEPTILTQFAIASPDFILFTAFVISIRAILERKSLLLAVGIFFLCAINMRGIFVGVILFICQNYYSKLQSNQKISVNGILKNLTPYLPTFIILLSYFIYYFALDGWFFATSSSDSHYAMPNGLERIIRHLAEFIFRSIENGRIIIWIIGFIVAYFSWKRRLLISFENKLLLSVFILLTVLYVLFIFISQMPFSARYFMPQFFILTILGMSGLTQLLKGKIIRLVFVLVILFELTGNFWIYPDKIAKSWDCTLAHLPYYELRKECFDYIDQQKLDYKDISAGFCLYGNREFLELDNAGKIIGSNPDRKFYIESNISNTEDSLAAAFKDKSEWKPVKRFEKGPVFIEIYEKTSNQNVSK